MTLKLELILKILGALIIISTYVFYKYYFLKIEYFSQIICKSHIPDYTRWILSDKYVGKEYAKQYGFEVPETYQLVEFPHHIKWDFKTAVIKPVDLCDGGGIYFIKDGKDFITGKKIKPEEIKKELQYLRSNIMSEYYMHEKMFQGLVPYNGYLVEELLLDENGNIPQDYKCYVFGGKIHYIAVTCDRKMIDGNQNFKSVWLDREFQPLRIPMIKKGYQYQKIDIPPGFEKMRELVENMGKVLKRHCRIDTYLINGKTYLGEFTFFCGASLHTKYANFQLGKLWKMYPDNYESQDRILSSLVPSYYLNPY